jgi:putative membrane-bound dehydrogenase-like protein
MSKALVALLAVIGLTAAAFRAPEHAPAQKPEEFPRVPATEPRDVAKTFHTLHGFRMDLLAAEPLVTDPVALEYDENGRAWVVEMRDYPYTDKSTDRPNVERTTDAPLGRIRILDDTDGDGLFDKSSIFAEDLSWPTGLALWKGGCYVTATPDVLYLKDTDGDGRADERRRVFTGFKKLNVQAVINNPRWGLDHKLYCAGASNGGEITKPGDAAFKPVRFGRADFAFDPNTEEFEVLTGGARFGQAFDDYGNRFLCNIRNPVQHVVFENRYLARNPYLVVTNAVHDCAEAGDTLPVYRASPPEPWRAARADRWRVEAGQTYPRSELAGEGYFTSACGITIYRGSAYPKEFYGNVFLGEVAGNLIHRETLTPDGVTFKAARADANAEFVASTDNWFRPVNFTNAPDGTLHVCDMYRETIEHPWSIPDDMKGKLDLESGRDRGRIYRLAPPNFQAPKTKPNLGKATTAELVRTLEHPDGWWRDTAHRLIFERQDKAAVEPLRKLLRESKDERARILAIWSLRGIDAFAEDDWLYAYFEDAAPQVRRQAVAAGEPFINGQTNKTWKAHAIGVHKSELGDSKPLLFQIALASGGDPLGSIVLSRILRTAGDDPWIATAALAGCRDSAAFLLRSQAELIPVVPATAPQYALFPPAVTRQLAFFVGIGGDDKAVRDVVRLIVEAEGEVRRKTPPLVAGLTAGLRRSNRSLASFTSDPKASAVFKTIFADAAKTAADANADLAARIGAVQLLGQSRYDEVGDTLTRLLDPRQPTPVQVDAVRALAGLSSPEVPAGLLANYRTLTPAVRAEIVDALASSTSRQPALLDAIEAKQVAAADVPLARRALLMKSKVPTVAARAAKLLTQSVGKRADVVAKYRPALQMAGNAERGHKVFSRECKTCHRLRDEGFDVGPNLATILHRSPDELLTHILDPNREVSPNYLEYAVALNDGRTLTGLIAEESAAGLTLRKAENVQQSILRSEIDEILSTGKSLMPEGLEQKLTPQDMADLLTFLLRRR